ncbi:MAG: efflux RND transporter periplasmic adaptor subunit [Verrucomicrobia bacterium]|nr:efflux RND transporter periplasmic adaptor subunit [Verrucomicrobiota bacterium]
MRTVTNLVPRRPHLACGVRRSALGCLGIALVLLASLAFAAGAPGPVEVRVARPWRGEIHRFVTLPGTIKANQQATLYAKVPGYLKALRVDKGETVKAGQVLGEIEVPELQADLAKGRAEWARAEAEAKVAALEASRLTKAREQAPDLVVPQAVDNAEARLAVARACVGTAQAEVERAELLLGYSRIAAPFHGVVTARFVDPGAFIPAATAGSAAQTAAILTVMDFDVVRAQVALPEAEAALANVGQPIKLSVDGLPGKTFTGQLSRISYALDEATRTMLVEADLANPGRLLRPGMYASVKVGVEKHADALLVPAAALVLEKANAFVFVAAGGQAKKTAVKQGFNDGVNAEILSGLTGQEEVVLVGKTMLADGQAIKVTEER